VQNNENEQWDEADVNRKLATKMERAADKVIDQQAAITAKFEPVDLRTAAYVLAIRRVGRVALDRGIWP
jgi:glutamate dehydrogenase (NAD(P)+)